MVCGGWMFQFHYGSIKIAAQFSAPYLASEFQFHYGSIKIIAAGLQATSTVRFQFHYGSIKICKFTLFLFQAWVSIPLWFD